MRAFVLGAGLGTRLRPLTEWLPKPLIPIFHRPLITYAFDHLLQAGVTDFIVNTHHCPQAYQDAFPLGEYGPASLSFRHEPVLLETAGGIANVADLLESESFFVYNGDILTDMPLAPLQEAHARAGNEVTLLVRSDGQNVNMGICGERVVDIRGQLGAVPERLCQFTGIYLVEPAFLRRLTPGKKESVVPIFQDMIRQGAKLGAHLDDRGHWWDLGDAETYRRVHSILPQVDFPLYRPELGWQRIHPAARVSEGATIDSESCIGPAAEVASGAVVRRSILWPGSHAAGVVEDEILRGSYERHRLAWR